MSVLAFCDHNGTCISYSCIDEFGIGISAFLSARKRGDVEHSVASIAAIRADFNWEPNISLENGLKELIEVNSS